MKYFFTALIIFLALVSCNNNLNPKIIREASSFEVLNDEIVTNFPGGLYLLENNIVWFDPFPIDHFLHILNKNDGRELYSFGNIGQGPNEYVSPMIDDIIWNDYLYIYDVNGNTKGYFSVDDSLRKMNSFIPLTQEDSLIRSKGYNIRLDSDIYIGLNTNKEENAYKLNVKGEDKSFGNYILPNEKKHFSAIYLYNSSKKLLIIGSIPVRYFSCYKMIDDNFELVWENRDEYNFKKQNSNINFDTSKIGIYGMAITRDFIVTIQRDYENDRTNEAEVLRDVNKIPKTLFIYDYNGKLQKIIDYQVPIGRICGNEKTNDLYAIFVAPDFKLGITRIE